MIPRLKIRGFEVCKGWEDRDIQIPVQATSRSAGYDFCIAEDITIPVNYGKKPALVSTGVKAYMKADEVLYIYARSSLCKLGLHLSNAVGVVDSDYYSNPDNDGHILFAIWNFGDRPIELKKGDRIGQGVFMNFLSADGDKSDKQRTGGFGSSGA